MSASNHSPDFVVVAGGASSSFPGTISLKDHPMGSTAITDGSPWRRAMRTDPFEPEDAELDANASRTPT